MRNKSDRLQFPLDSFWVSEPYSNGAMSLGKFEETLKNSQLKSPGDGEIVMKTKDSITIRSRSKGRDVLVTMFPIEFLDIFGEIKKGELLGYVTSPHLKIQCIVDGLNIQVNPLYELYLHPHQYNRSNIPNHTPRPVPKRLVD